MAIKYYMLVFWFLLLGLKPLTAQWDVKLTGGLSSSRLKTGYYSDMRSYIGMDLGVGMVYSLSERHKLAFDIKKVARGSVIPFEDNSDRYYFYEFDYFRFSTRYRFSYGFSKLNFHGDLGAYVGLMHKAFYVYKKYDPWNSTYTDEWVGRDIKHLLKKGDWGLTFGLGASYPLSKRIQIHLDFGLDKGLLNINRLDFQGFKQYNHAIFAEVGMAYRLKPKQE